MILDLRASWKSTLGLTAHIVYTLSIAIAVLLWISSLLNTCGILTQALIRKNNIPTALSNVPQLVKGTKYRSYLG